MLTIFTRAIVVYFFLLIAMRLMGKKQLGELQPFEFAITLIVAELACIPMSDSTVPVTFGLVPIFTLFVVHLTITKLVRHSIKMRKLINGKPIIVINPKGIDISKLKELDMTINDLLESLRSMGYFSPSEVRYAIIETNGDLSVLAKSENQTATLGDLNIDKEEKNIPVTLICEGKKMSENIKVCGADESVIDKLLNKYKLQQKHVLLLTVLNGTDIFLQPINGAAINTTTEELQCKGQ